MTGILEDFTRLFQIPGQSTDLPTLKQLGAGLRRLWFDPAWASVERQLRGGGHDLSVRRRTRYS